MPLPPPFPIRIEDLDADFLSQALGGDVRSVSSARVGADRGMLGEIFLLDIDGDVEPTRLAAKFAALREGSLASALRGRNYERELRCYEELLTDTPARTPVCHGTWYDAETAHFLLLQEAIDADGTVDQVHGIGVERARPVLDEIAALHARWWHSDELPNNDWLPRLDGDLRLANLTTLAELGWPQLVEMLGEDLPVVPPDFGEGLPQRIEAALRSVAGLPHTLLHCDLRADNLLFDRHSDAVTLVDWQGCGLGPAAFDVAYFLIQSLTIEERRASQHDLLDYWRAALARHGVPDTERAADGYSASIWYGMAIACALPVISDPDEPRVRELAHAVASRTIAALIDHDELEAPP
ncbi:MAG: phosphotransferase [Actinomycetota bacterium]